MRTKHILTALALPALFAACTAEDIVSVESNMQQDRAKLSENFVLKVGSDAVDSRYAVNSGKPEFETGDKIGAAIIDQFTYGKDVEDWTIIQSLANNTPFTYDQSTGEWSVPENQPMGIGNYFFKFPYDKSDRSRAAVIYSLPVIQNQFDENGKYDTDQPVEDANMAIAHAVFTEEDEMGDISMKNIFTYPKFRIQFDNGEKVNTVTKVVLYATGSNDAVKENGFIVKSGFNHRNVVKLFNNDKTTAFYDATAKATDWDLVETNSLIYNVTPTAENAADDEAGVAEVEKSTYIIAQLPENTEVSYDSNTKNKYIEVRFVLPAENNLADVNLGMYVYTDNGMYMYADVAEAIQFKKTTAADVKKSVFARNKNYNLTLKVLDEAEKAEQKIVASNEDWNELVSVYGDVKKGKYDVVIVGEEFGFDETTEMPEAATFTIKGNAIVKGEATLSNVKVEGNTYVKEGAVLTTSGTFDPADIYNEGEVVIAQVLNEKGKVVDYDKISTIYNEGTLTINEETEATFALYNAKKSVVENNGEINIENALIESVEEGNYGTIENKGIINLTGDFTNEAEEWNTARTKIVNMPTINNEGEIFAMSGDLTNDGTINNEEDAVMTCKNQDGEINNNGTLNVVNGSVTYITANNGEIVVDKAVPAELVVKGAKGTISYEAEGSLSFKNSLVNTIHVIDDITISNLGSVKTICVDADAEITLPAAAEITALNVEEDATATLESSLKVASVTVEEDAALIIPAEVKLEVTTSTFDNQGVIRVAGSLYAESVVATEAGVVKDNGTSAEIKFYDVESATLQGKWNAAVAAWSKAATNEGWYKWYTNNETEYYNGNPYDYAAFYATAIHDAWKTREVMTALGTAIVAPQYNTDGTIKNVPAKFTTAVDNLLKATANKTAAEAKLYNADGEFKLTWAVTNTLFTKVSDMQNDMATKLNTVATIQNVFGNDAIAAGYAWYAKSSIWTKLNAEYPYAYVWKSTADLVCPLYDVCDVIAKADAAGWNALFGTSFVSINSIADVKNWLQAAAVTEATTTLGKLAKEIADLYYTDSRVWGYNDDQVCNCLNGAIFTLTGVAGTVTPDAQP